MPVNEFSLLHTEAQVRRAVGVDVHELGKIDGAYGMKFCETKGNVANMVFDIIRDVGENEKVVIHGIELKSLPAGEGYYRIDYTEQRKVHLPSMALIGEPYLWDQCPSCKKARMYACQIVKKGDLTVSLEKCLECHPENFFPHIRNGWGKDPKSIPESVDKMTSNNKYVVFYVRALSTEERHKFYKLKWSDLEKGNLTGIGLPVSLPTEVLTLDEDILAFFLNRHDQLCVLWYNGSLILDGKFFKIETLKEFKKGRWDSMLELESRTNRYVVAGHCGEHPDYVAAITLIDGRAKVLSNLMIKDRNAYEIKMSLLGSSTLIISLGDSLSIVAVKSVRLKLIANEVPVFQRNCRGLRFISGSNNGKRLLMVNTDNHNIASVRLRYH